MAIKNKAPGISMSGDLDILKTNTSRAVKQLHDDIKYLHEQNQELREMMDKLTKEDATDEVPTDTPADTPKPTDSETV